MKSKTINASIPIPNEKRSSNLSDNDQYTPVSFPGYPKYPEEEDIYEKAIEEIDLDPENLWATKSPNIAPQQPNELSFEEDESGEDLDVPGSELDDEKESIGSEDEENNYYSIGGDNHNNLEENQGD